MGFRFWIHLRSQNETDLKFELLVKVSVKGDVWILVPHLGPETNIVDFRNMGLWFQLHQRSQNKTDLKFGYPVKVQVKGDIWKLVPQLGISVLLPYQKRHLQLKVQTIQIIFTNNFQQLHLLIMHIQHLSIKAKPHSGTILGDEIVSISVHQHTYNL